LDRLKPSLQKHVGCDLLDINPGAGVWSSKLHDFLKPRTHILLEPDASAYEPLLKPLLDKPDSKYKLVRKSGIVWPHLESVLTEGDLPAQEVLKSGDPRLNEPNNTLLVTANLGYNPKKGFRGFESVAHLVVYQFIRAIRSHELFHRYGQIRMLLWIDDAEKKLILRRSIGRRRKQDIEFEALCKIREIASSTDYLELDKEYGKYGRPITLDLEGTRQVMEKMKQHGIMTPKNRESLTMEYLAEYDAGKLDQSRKSARHKKFEKLYEAGELPETIVDEDGQTKPNPDWSALIRHRYHEGWKAKQEVHRTDLIEEYEALLIEQSRIFREDGSSPDVESQKIEFHRRYEKWQDRMDHLYLGERYGVRSIVDNIAAFKANPPLLPWDRREFEPLKVQPTEFFPEHPMALLDVQPSAPWPIFQEDPENSYHAFEYIIAPLFRAPAQNLPRALKSLYPGAFEAIVPECPSLTDPTKGGVFDVNNLLVKNLTIEMIQEICSAWMNWPFRPSKYEMIFQSGSSLAEDPDAYERTEEFDE
jgi:transcription factor 1